MLIERLGAIGWTRTGLHIRSATVRSMKTQDKGCAPCWKTATRTPEGSTQNSAFPLKKLGLVHSRVPVLLKENVVVMSPGFVLGAK